MAAADFEETVEELELKLQQYGEQLSTVEAALAQQPEEEALQKLRGDLKEVISLTADLLSFQKAAAGGGSSSTSSAGKEVGEGPGGAREGKKKASSSATGADDESRSTSSGGAGVLAARAAGGKAQQVDDGAGNEEGDTAGDNTASTQSRVEAVGGGRDIRGRTCIAALNGRHVHAEVIEVKGDPKLGDRVVVRPLTSKSQRHELALSSISLLNPPAAALLVEGTHVQAIYSHDGKWYDCKIEEATEAGFRVVFTDYGDQEEVKFDQVRLPKAKKDDKNKKTKEIVTPGGYRLPEFLVIRETDTDAQKIVKRRKAKGLKKEQRDERQEKEWRMRAQSWRTFNQKASSRKIAGYLTGRGHESIFKSSDASAPVSKVEAAHHSNVANTFAPRRKHDFNDGDDMDD